jgi:hypothetical protein
MCVDVLTTCSPITWANFDPSFYYPIGYAICVGPYPSPRNNASTVVGSPIIMKVLFGDLLNTTKSKYFLFVSSYTKLQKIQKILILGSFSEIHIWILDFRTIQNLSFIKNPCRH